MLELRTLLFRYPGSSARALDGVSTTFPDGSFVAVMGANGSGKSTLARCLNGLLLPVSGEVIVNGHSTADENSRHEIRQQVGLVFQNPHLQITSLTVEREIAFGLQNLGIAPDEILLRVQQQLTAFGLEKYRSAPPLNLSAGEQQRLALASVLAMEPACLVLDESTSLLSPSSRVALLEAVDRVRKERSMGVVLITQFPDEALRAERLIVLQQGRIALDGSPAGVFEKCAAISGMGISIPLRSQLGLPA